MGKKNNGGIVVLTGIIIVILVILCILFATNTISVNYNSAKETTSQKKDNQQDNNDENANNNDSSNDVKLNDTVSLYNVYQKEDSSLFNICSDFNCDISVKYSNLSDFINGLMKKNEIIEIAKSDKSILENDIYNIPFTEIKNEGESNFYNIYIANNINILYNFKRPKHRRNVPTTRNSQNTIYTHSDNNYVHICNV